jgi:DNA polymerase-3 subunit delta
MILTLTGSNNFSLQAKSKRLIADFVNKYGDLALEKIDGQETSIDKISEALTSLPFLAERKMVILREPGTNKQFAEQAEQLFDNLPETTDVILVEPKLDKRLSYYKFLKKNTDFNEFPELDQNDLSRYLVESAKGKNGSISSSDARYLVERVGAIQQLLANELEKLLLYDPKITRQTIDLLTEPAPQSTIFQLLEAAFAGQTKKTLDLYAEQRALKVEPQQIIAMLAWQLHVLAVIKAASNRSADEIAKDAKLNPFVVRKSQGIAKNLTLREVKQLISDLLEIDLQMKSTNIDADEALRLYLIKL